MKTISILLIVYASLVVICFALAVRRRLHNKEGLKNKIGKDVLNSFVAALFFPIVIYMGIKALYYRNRPRPIPKKQRKWFKSDRVYCRGKMMSLAEYNATHKRQFTLEQVYGKKYVASLSEEEKAGFDKFENKIEIGSDLPDDPYTKMSIVLAEALYMDDFSKLSKCLAEDVKMIRYKRETIVGQSGFVDYWKGFLKRVKGARQPIDVEVKKNNFIGRAIVSIHYRDIQDDYVFLYIESAKIKLAIITQRQQQPIVIRYHDLEDPAIPYETIMKEKGEAVDAEPNRMPCLHCGCLSEGLEWYKLNHDSGPYAHVGKVSVCPHCKEQAEFYPEIFVRKD